MTSTTELFSAIVDRLDSQGKLNEEATKAMAEMVEGLKLVIKSIEGVAERVVTLETRFDELMAELEKSPRVGFE